MCLKILRPVVPNYAAPLLSAAAKIKPLLYRVGLSDLLELLLSFFIRNREALSQGCHLFG